MGNVQVKYEFDGINNPWIYKAKELEKQKERDKIELKTRE